ARMLSTSRRTKVARYSFPTVFPTRLQRRLCAPVIVSGPAIKYAKAKGLLLDQRVRDQGLARVGRRRQDDLGSTGLMRRGRRITMSASAAFLPEDALRLCKLSGLERAMRES